MKLPGKRAVFLLYACALLLPVLAGSFREQAGAGKMTAKTEAPVRETGTGGGTVETGAGGRTAETDAGSKAEAQEDEKSRQVALTFDDGPSPDWTPKLLDGLKERNVRATFFLIGMYAVQYPEIVERMDREGHLIGNHTYHHVQLDLEDKEHLRREIGDTDKVIYLITGKHTDYVRPPFGVWDERLEEELQVLPVLWTVDPLDWTTENTDQIVEKVVTEAEDGDIILLHDCYESSVEAALRIVDILRDEGFAFVTADELVLP